MNTGEAIKFLKNKQWLEPNEITDILEMFEEFEECKLFKKMWKAFKKKYKYYPMAKINKEGLLEVTTDNMLVEFNMDEFEQKYFPKEDVKK